MGLFIVTTPDSHSVRVIASPNYKHQYATVKYYDIRFPISKLYSPKLIESRYISMKPETYKIFSNLVPKPGVKRYLSEYGELSYEENFGGIYFAFYRNGVKIYDTNALAYRETTRESPIDNDILNFIYLYVLGYPE